MSDDDPASRGVPVPADRLSRLLRIGGLAGGIAGGMMADGLRQLATGKRPTLSDLLMTPANAMRVTTHLSQMRGAAMKVGQLMSMDAGDVLPPELATILSRLRADASHMPPKQLQSALNAEWGKGWISRFARFDVRPIAAASIGQVHRALTKDGRDLAIKVQYPGIRGSIDSDVSNMAALLRLSPMPGTIDTSGLMADARRQLHEEADYAREGASLTRFAALVSDTPDLKVPRLHPDFCTPNVLAMEFVDSVPLETLATGPQDIRDRAMTALVHLTLRELFEFHLMQTDPNFANYRYAPATGQVVLLDFGATRPLPAALAKSFRDLLNAGLNADREATRQAAIDVGLFAPSTDAAKQETILEMFAMAMEPLCTPGPFDFGTSDLATRLRDKGLALGAERDFWHIPPTDTLFVQRKVVGMYLLASRLKARVRVADLVTVWR